MEEVHTFPMGVSISLDGTRMVRTGFFDNKAIVWDLTNWEREPNMISTLIGCLV